MYRKGAMTQHTKLPKVVLGCLFTLLFLNANAKSTFLDPSGLYQLTPRPKYIKNAKGKVVDFVGRDGSVKARLISKGNVHIHQGCCGR
jgi:hypothetical protein